MLGCLVVEVLSCVVVGLFRCWVVEVFSSKISWLCSHLVKICVNLCKNLRKSAGTEKHYVKANCIQSNSSVPADLRRFLHRFTLIVYT